VVRSRGFLRDDGFVYGGEGGCGVEAPSTVRVVGGGGEGDMWPY